MTMSTTPSQSRAQAATGLAVPIEYLQRVHAVETTCDPDPEGLLLRDLVEAVAEFSDNEAEVVATVMHMLRSGRAKLRRPVVEPATSAKLCG